MQISEFEFLSTAAAHIQPKLIYIYRTGFLKSAILKHISSVADCRGLMKQSATPRSLPQQLTQASLFSTEAMTICEVVNSKAEEVSAMQISLNLIADGETHSFCLIVSGKNRILADAAWGKAVKSCLVIDEPEISKGNLPAAFSFLLQHNGLDVIAADEKTVAYKTLQSFVGADSWGLDRISKQLDFYVLAPGWVDNEFDGDRKKRGEVLNECLKDFLDESTLHVMRRLLALLDDMKSRRLMDNQDILTQLYSVTTRVISGTDKRYRHNKLGLAPPREYLTWALHLLANQRSLMFGPFLTAAERQCRNYMNIDDHPKWLADPLNWKGSFRKGAIAHEAVGLKTQRDALVKAIIEAFVKIAAKPPSIVAAMEELAIL